MSVRARIVGLASGVAVLLTSMAAAPVAGATAPAGPPPVTAPFVVIGSVGGACLQGFPAADPLFDGDSVRIVHKRGARTLARKTVTVAAGKFKYCRPPLLAGDRISIKHGTSTRTITVPAISGRIDTAADLVVVDVPAENRDLRLQWRDMVLGQSIGGQDRYVTADVDGHRAVDLKGDIDVRGGDWVYVWWNSPAGDSFMRILGTPSVRAKLGDRVVRGSGAPGSRVTARLRTSGGAMRATATATVGTGAPAFSAKLALAGKAATPKAGDRLSLSEIPGRTLTLRRGDVAVDPSSGGLLTATCPADGQYIVLRNGQLAAGGAIPGDGHLFIGPLDPSLDPLPPATKVVLGCETEDGLGQLWSTTPG